jgi:SHS2 domain-containing protein
LLILSQISWAQTDTIKVEAVSKSLEKTVVYSADDTILYDFLNKIIYLVGKSKVVYGEIELTAHRIYLDLNTNKVRAEGYRDSAGILRDFPIFIEGGTEYQMEELAYNFQTKKGIISGAITQQGEGFMVIDSAKKQQDDVLCGVSGRYTTCNLKEPHFAIRSSRIKTKPGKYVISGPFNLEFNGVPTPLGFVFGMFPVPKTRNSGFIVPTYGEQPDQGFFLRDGGFYWAGTKNIDLTLRGNLYTLGSWGVNVSSNYAVKYAFTGNFLFDFNKIVQEQRNLEKTSTEAFRLSWRHTPFAKGTARFMANVDLQSTNFNRLRARTANEFISPAFTSNIRYDNSLTLGNTPITYGFGLRQNQNQTTRAVTIEPQGNLTIPRIFPFKSKTGKKNLLTQLNFNYTLNFSGKAGTLPNNIQQQFGFPTLSRTQRKDTLDFNLANIARMFEDFEFGFKHDIPVSTTVNVLKFIQLSPSFNYSEIWYPKRLDFQTQGDTIVNVRSLNSFSRTYNYSGSVSANTRLYAFYRVKIKNVQMIRQMFVPTVGFSYTPDFSNTPLYQQFRLNQTIQGRDTTIGYVQSRFQGQGFFLGSGGARGRNGSLNFGISSQIEAKLNPKSDTAQDQKPRKINLIQGINLSGSYNLAADSFNLSALSMGVRTVLFKNLNISLDGSIDPYAYLSEVRNAEGIVVQTARRTPVYAWRAGQGIGRLTSAGAALSTNFQAKEKKKRTAKNEEQEQVLRHINERPDLYVDFNVPWALNFSYNLRYSSFLNRSSITQTFNFGGNMSLTPKWKFQFNSGYDFARSQFSYTSLGIMRDLHCWQMSINYIPFGPMQSYSVNISVKAAALQDLKVNKQDQWFDRLR